MKILVIGDEESRYLWDYYDKKKLEDIDLIISCGDLDPDYLSFLTTMTSLPVLYVHGNHDERYLKHPPEGCICIDDRIYVYHGIRIMGLGGSMNYCGGKFQYTEEQMRRRVYRLWFQLLKNKSIDILVTHAPAAGIHDGEDLPHKGFEIFRRLIERYRPRYFVHGHVHMTYGRQYKRYDTYGETIVINAYERYVIEYENESNKNHKRVLDI